MDLTTPTWGSLGSSSWGSITAPWVQAAIQQVVGIPAFQGVHRTLSKADKEAVVTVKFALRGYSQQQVQKILKRKDIKVRMKDIEFVRNQIFINNINVK